MKNRLDKIAYKIYSDTCYNKLPVVSFKQFVEFRNMDKSNCSNYYKLALPKIRKEKLKKLSNITK